MEWIVGAVLSFFGLLGIGKLLAMAYAARLERQKVQKALDQTNSGKEIDADVDAFQAVMKRLEKVEMRVDELQDKLSLEMQKSARLEAENENLKAENTRQAKRIHDLADHLQQKDAQIAGLHREIDAMRAEMERMKTEFNKGNQL
jgi:cell division protein FtsB